MWFFRSAISQDRIVKDWQDYKSHCGIKDDLSDNSVLDPYEIMIHAIKFAHMDSKAFEPRLFKFAMQSMFFGNGFEEVVSGLDKKLQSRVLRSQKEFNTALDKLTNAVRRGVQDATLNQPQENGPIRKFILRMMHACKAITTMLCVCSTNAASNSLVCPEKFNNTMSQVFGFDTKFVATDHAKVALGTGMIAYSLHKVSSMIDITNPASRAEEYMDKLIDEADKGFKQGIDQVIKSLPEESDKKQKLKNVVKHAARIKKRGAAFSACEKKQNSSRSIT